MSVTQHQIRSGAYYDSVVLMQLQKGLLELSGVEDAGAVMATPANRDLLLQSDLLPELDATVKPDDLLIVVRAANKKQADAALAQVDQLLARRRSEVQTAFVPRSLDTAASALPDARWVLISVPGQYAAGVAEQALDLGKHVFLYSDNVSLDDEIRLKQAARQKGLLVMGPDCGTAIINGVGLGFANRVRRGSIGLVGASGTGLQAITSRIHALGGGVSHALGTGGRDLKAEVGGLTTQQALRLLASDPHTRVIVLVSKPPSGVVAADVLRRAMCAGKPVVVNFIGYAPPAAHLGNLHFAASLGDAAALAVELVERDETGEIPVWREPSSRRFIRGLFSGGTLATEAARALSAIFTPVYSNVASGEAQPLADVLASQAHTILDLGDDAFTQGRLHPMMDNALRIRRMRHEARDPEVAVLLLDVVLGEGAHPDPAPELAPVIEEVVEQGLDVAVILVGTPDDPQGVDAQRERLANAGATVFEDTLPAVEYLIATRASPPADDALPVPLADLNAPLAAINVGLESFYASLTEQGAKGVQVEWRPPAGGNEKLAGILAKMKKR